MRLEPVTLEGATVRLEPIREEFAADLWAVSMDDSLWAHMPVVIDSVDTMRTMIQRAQMLVEHGAGLTFVIREIAGQSFVGSTSYLNVEPAHRRLEIGFTWVTPAWQRTSVNTECKFLLMRHAFERLGCIRVEFKTDSLNEPSRAALVRIGAVEEGTLRNHMIMPSGRYRHSTYYSVTDDRWPDVKARLLTMLER